MRLLVDADGCPIVDAALSAARRAGVEAVLVCDSAHEFRRTDAAVVVVPKGADSADFKLVNMLGRGDIVVTQDYGLAAMCLARGAYALNQNGLVYTEENIDALLMARHTARKIRSAGERLKGPSRRTPAQDAAFTAALEDLLRRVTDEGRV